MKLIYVDPPLFPVSPMGQRVEILVAITDEKADRFTLIDNVGASVRSHAEWIARVAAVADAHEDASVWLDQSAERGGMARAALAHAGVENIRTLTAARSPMLSLLAMQHAIGQGRLIFEASPELSAEIFTANAKAMRVSLCDDAYALLAFWHAWRSPLSSRLHEIT